MSLEEIILEIEDASIICNKAHLITNSDYFKAMLEGNFIERSQDRIKLEGVDLKAMNIILSLIRDDSYFIEKEDMLMVLQTACMLQFVQIKTLCVDILTEMLSPKNCLPIWLVTESLDIKQLYLKAKLLALDEFLIVKDTECILELTLEQIFIYLGHVNLKTDHEFTVLQTAMKWWYQNGNSLSDKALLKLFSCIDFRNLCKTDLKEFLIYPDIYSSDQIKEILSCLMCLKNEHSVADFSEDHQKIAQLLYNARHRTSAECPSILVEGAYSNCSRQKDIKWKIAAGEQWVIYYDYNINKFKKFLLLDESKCHRLEGFKLIGYKEYVFLYGGQFFLGNGEWNYNFWAYDTIREKWERKSLLAYPRRHFETCIVGTKVFITGGTGLFRRTQNNIFWYDFKEDIWSATIHLPFDDRQVKCCNFLNRYFLLSVEEKCGYFLNDNVEWTKVRLDGADSILSQQPYFAIFSYRNKLYIKGKDLIELVWKGDALVVVSVKHITSMDCDIMEVTVCSNIVYTFYKVRALNEHTLEKYDLESDERQFIFKDAHDVIATEDDRFSMDVSVAYPSFKIFSFKPYTSVEGNKLINYSFM